MAGVIVGAPPKPLVAGAFAPTLVVLETTGA